MNRKQFYTSITIYVISGILSVDIVVNSYNAIYSGLAPGMFFILATLLSAAVCAVPFRKANAILYFMVLYVIYLFLFYGAVSSVYPGWMTGTVVSVTGAIASISCYHAFIKKITHPIRKSVGAGAMAVVVMVLCQAGPFLAFMEDPVLAFSLAGMFLQIVVGTLITRLILKKHPAALIKSQRISTSPPFATSAVKQLSSVETE